MFELRVVITVVEFCFGTDRNLGKANFIRMNSFSGNGWRKSFGSLSVIREGVN